MIDEKINNSLKELEQVLKNVESARKQVEKTVNSYDGLNATTAEYVNKLGNVTNKIQEIVDSIGKDYAKKATEFEKDRKTVIKASTAINEELSNATEEFKNSWTKIQNKMKYGLIFITISLVIVITLFIFFLINNN